MIEEVQITKSDLTRVHPGARCRCCGVVTWKVSLSQGQIRTNARHRPGCPKPPGRIDLLQDVPLRHRETLFGGRLLRPMTDGEIAVVAEELHGLLDAERRA